MSGPAQEVGDDEVDALLLESQVSELQERIAELEFLRDDVDWERIDDGGTDLDLSRTALRRIIREAQVMSLANPLIDHAVTTIAHYVFGQGVAISGNDVTNDRVQELLREKSNRKVLFGQQALMANDRQLTYEGNLFFALFGRAGGVTRIRRIRTFDILAGDIITNPDDDADVWLYKRRIGPGLPYITTTPDRPQVIYYPDIDFEPDARPEMYGEGYERGPIAWESPVIHVRDGGLTGSKFGVPIIYSSLAWARAVSRDLSDYATIRRALARFTWKVTAKTRAAATSARQRMSTTVSTTNPVERNPPPVTGATFIGTEGNSIEPIRTAGAAPSPEEGRRLWLMVAAGVGIPETMLSGNADAGNLATAKTLDRPTELMMTARQYLWAEALSRIIRYDLERAVADGVIPAEAPVRQRPSLMDITAPVEMEPVSLDPTVTFPSVLEPDTISRVDAIVRAATLSGQPLAGTIPDDTTSRLLMTALGVTDVEAEMEKLAAAPPVTPAPPPVTPTVFAEALDAFTDTIVSGTDDGSRPGRPRRRSS